MLEEETTWGLRHQWRLQKRLGTKGRTVKNRLEQWLQTDDSDWGGPTGSTREVLERKGKEQPCLQRRSQYRADLIVAVSIMHVYTVIPSASVHNMDGDGWSISSLHL